MAGPNLPVNVDATYADSGTDTTVKLHQQHHDAIHDIVNKIDTAVGTAVTGDVLTWNGTVYGPEAPDTGGGGGGVTEDTEVMFSTLSGADDDAKLASFMAAESGSAYAQGRCVVLDEQRDYNFGDQQEVYNGFAIRGLIKSQDIRSNGTSSAPYAQRVRLQMTGGWFTLPAGSTYNVSISNMSIDGNTGNRLLDGRADNILWTSVFRDIAIQDSSGVFGTAAQPVRVTAPCLDGFWYVASQQARPFNFAGSDFYFNPSMMLLDTDPGLLADSEYMFGAVNLGNAWVNNIYCTAEGQAALLVSGSATNDVSKWFQDLVLEGRNNTAYSPGCLVRWTGSQGQITKTRFAHAMANPTLSGRSPTDAGVIHMTAGNATITDCTYDRQSTVAETVPFVYANGASSTVRVERITPVGDVWTGKPVVQVVSGATAYVDDSVDVVADATSKVISPGRFLEQNKQTGTAYTLVTLDAGKVLEMNNASAGVVTFPVLPEGQTGRIRRYGAGAVTFAASGTTLRVRGGLTGINGQYGEVTYTYRTTTEVVIAGDLV